MASGYNYKGTPIEDLAYNNITSTNELSSLNLPQFSLSDYGYAGTGSEKFLAGPFNNGLWGTKLNLYYDKDGEDLPFTDKNSIVVPSCFKYEGKYYRCLTSSTARSYQKFFELSKSTVRYSPSDIILNDTLIISRNENSVSIIRSGNPDVTLHSFSMPYASILIDFQAFGGRGGTGKYINDDYGTWCGGGGGGGSGAFLTLQSNLSYPIYIKINSSALNLYFEKVDEKNLFASIGHGGAGGQASWGPKYNTKKQGAAGKGGKVKFYKLATEVELSTINQYLKSLGMFINGYVNGVDGTAGAISTKDQKKESARGNSIQGKLNFLTSEEGDTYYWDCSRDATLYLSPSGGRGETVSQSPAGTFAGGGGGAASLFRSASDWGSSSNDLGCGGYGGSGWFSDDANSASGGADGSGCMVIYWGTAGTLSSGSGGGAGSGGIVVPPKPGGGGMNELN